MIENGILKPSNGVQHRGGTYSVLKSQNPLLARREIMVEVDTGRIKVGDGINRWNDLPYSSDYAERITPILTVDTDDFTLNLNANKTINIDTSSDGDIEVICSNSNVSIESQYTPILGSTGFIIGQKLTSITVSGDNIGNSIITIKVNSSKDYFAIETTINVVVVSVLHRYGYRISKEESDPYARVEYLYDAVGKTPAHMDFTNGVFDYGSWSNVWFITDNKPCMLKSDGTVDYYLDPNDYTKKEDGITASDVANTSYNGNAMAQIPLCWIYRYEDDDYYYEIVSDGQYDENYKAYAHTRADGSIADYFYYGMFACTGATSKFRSLSGQSAVGGYKMETYMSGCEANGENWSMVSWSQHELIRTLLVLLGKSTKSRDVYGQGYSIGTSWAGRIPLNSGTLISLGQFFGYTTYNQAMKVFHIENFIGNQWTPVTGAFYYNGVAYIKMTPEGDGYKATDYTGYTNTGITAQKNSDRIFPVYVSCSEYGIIPTDFRGGSSSTYFCDYSGYNSSGLYVFNLAQGYNYQNMGGMFSVGILDNSSSGTSGSISDKYGDCYLSCFPPATVEEV